MAYKRLGDMLLQQKLITEEQLNRALEQGRREGKRIGETLIDSGVISEMQMIDMLCVQLGVEFIDLTKAVIPTQLATVVPKSMARKYSVVPVKQAGETLHLAMEDPLNFVAIEEIKSATKKRIVPMIATRNGIQRGTMTLYGNEGVSRAIDEMQRTMGQEETSGPAGVSVTPEEDTGETAPAIRLVNSIIERGASENASDIHMEPRDGEFVVRMRIDGVLHTVLTVPKNLQNSVISRVKIMGDMDISERRIPQDGRANIHVQGRDIDLRISTLPTKYGEKTVIRFLEKSSSLLSSHGIGLEGDHLKEYQSLIQNANGVILIAGPTGSGKSTTMYTMISDLNREEVNLVTLEDPIEYNIDGVNQVQINEKVNMTFASGLRSILRQDPDIIAIGEIRDGETAEIAMRSAITGHLVLSTIHTNSAIATMDRLIDIGVEPYLITSALKGIIAQRLVRKICPHCRKEYIPTDEDLELLEMDRESLGDRKFYRGAGCPECLNSGYRGRTAVFEILLLNSDIKAKFRENPSGNEYIRTARATGFHPMVEDCRRLILDGITTPEEARKILHTTDG